MEPREDVKLRQHVVVEGLYTNADLTRLQTSLARSARRARRARRSEAVRPGDLGKPQSSRKTSKQNLHDGANEPMPNAEIKKVPPELEALQNSQMQRHHKIKGGKRKDCPVKTLI